MKITVWGINYGPELTGIAPYNQALCEFLSQQGHLVRMVTGFPYYPAWEKIASDRRVLFRTEQMGKVNVHRCWQFVPQHPWAMTRILHELSFVVMSFLRLLMLPRPDVFIVVSPPLLLGAAAWLLTRLKRAPFVFHVQDLQPDAACALGMLKRGWLTRALYALESFAYRKARRVSGISQGMIDAFLGKGVPPAKALYFPNGVHLPELESLPQRGLFRQRLGLSPDSFLAVYSGNLGVKQGLEVLIEAARQVRNSRVRIVICGDGSRRQQLAKLVEASGLANVIMLPLQPEQQFLEMLADTDLALITQESGTGQFFFPSKLLRTLAMAKPVLTVADQTSELARALERGGFGINIQPNQPERIASVLEALVQDASRLKAMGEAGRNFVEQFEFNKVLREFESVVTQLPGNDSPSRPAIPFVSKDKQPVET